MVIPHKPRQRQWSQTQNFSTSSTSIMSILDGDVELCFSGLEMHLVDEGTKTGTMWTGSGSICGTSPPYSSSSTILCMKTQTVKNQECRNHHVHKYTKHLTQRTTLWCDILESLMLSSQVLISCPTSLFNTESLTVHLTNTEKRILLHNCVGSCIRVTTVTRTSTILLWYVVIVCPLRTSFEFSGILYCLRGSCTGLHTT